MIRTAGTIALALVLVGAAGAQAANLQSIGSFDQPTYLTSDPGNPDRLFVVEREGVIEQVQNGTVTTFADLRSLVLCCEGERGFLSIALAPDFDSSGRLYVDYTGKEEPGEIHLAELRSSGSTAPLSTLRDVLVIPHSEEINHHGGQLQFGPDGYLWMSVGNGGGANDKHHNAQNLMNPFGKILRIDPRQSGVLPYTVPGDNPFADVSGDFAPIWSYGLRNPFRFSFDRLTNDLVIADVGQAAREEIDYAPAPSLGRGANYGWNCREGLIEGPATDPECLTPPVGGYVDPVFDYPHVDPGGGAAHGCAITGGYVVRDPSLADLYGRYLYGDYCTGEIRSFAPSNPFGSDRSEGLVVPELDSFGEDSCGRIYAVSKTGAISRLTASTPTLCATEAAKETEAAKAGAYVGVRAKSRRVKRGGRALITAWASPCSGREGELVKLLRGGQHIATGHLDRACSVRFTPRIRHRSGFRATIAEDATYFAAASRPLKILIDHRKRHRKANASGHGDRPRRRQ
jgi:hypothetical protein